MEGVLNVRRALYPKMLNLIILPTEKCNFRCTYCYEDFEIGKMKRPIIEGIKNLIKARVERESIEALELSWFGGEPTLAIEIVEEISEFSKQYFDDGRIKYLHGDLTTNGYLLTKKNLERLVSLKQSSFQISLDGYGEGHDQTRKYASGKGTFNTIWTNLLAAAKTDLEFQITLRLHQTAANGDSMAQLVDEICKNFGHDKRFSVFFKTIENLGGPNAKDITKMDKDRAGDRVSVFAAKLREFGFAVSAVLDGPESSKGTLEEPSLAIPMPPETVQGGADQPQGRARGYNGYICYASKPNSLMIRADGRVGKCTVMLDDPRNTIGQINPDGTVEIDNHLVSVWMRGFKTMDPIELGCPAQNLPKVDVSESPITFHKKPKSSKAAVKLAELVAA